MAPTDLRRAILLIIFAALAAGLLTAAVLYDEIWFALNTVRPGAVG
jgi:hypothetical protein